MAEHMTQTSQIGDLFKQKRKERNLSLKEAENATSIRMSYLRAIENGEIAKLISPVYAEGFVRQYAVFLGIDGDQIIKDNPDIFNKRVAQEFTYGIGTLEARDNPGAGVKWLPNAVWIGAFALLLIVAWYMARFLEVI
jgi:cytoskeletal protein RodZ